jgi:hypothetical protein
MKKHIKAAIVAGITAVCVSSIAFATTPETVMKTYPTRWRLVYDTDRDSLTGDTNLLIEGVGDAPNGRVANGTGTGVVTVYGDLNVTGATNTAYTELFAEGASKGIAAFEFDGTASSGTAGAVDILYTGAGHRFISVPLGAGQTITVPTMAAGGLDITGDQADNEGFDIFAGVLGASGRPMIPGTDPAFYFCATLTVTDVSDTDELFVGWRKPEVVQATDADFDTYAQIGIIASAATAAIKITTEDDGGGATTTDTTDTWADAATKALCVNVSAAGVVTYTINGAAPTVTAAFTFDDGEPVIPTVRFLHAGAADCVPVLSRWEVGYSTTAFQ